MDHVKPFSYSGRSLTVKASPYADKWEVRVYEKDNAVTDVVYMVRDDRTMDAERSSVSPTVLHELMGLAQSDVMQGRVALLPRAP